MPPLRVSLGVLVGLLPTAGVAQNFPVLTDLLDTTLESSVGTYGFYGSTAAIQFGDGSVWTGTTGVTGPADASQGGRALTVDDRFHIGSQTKTYTGTVVLQFVDEGIISLDDTLQDWYERAPDSTQALEVMPEDLRATITIHDLISMRSGLGEYLAGTDPKNPDQTVLTSWNNASGNYDLTREELLTASLSLPSTMTVGDPTTFSYSNTNFMLAGLIAEAASCEAGNCQTIRELIETNVVAPTGLDDTFYPVGTEWGTTQHTNGTWDFYGELTDFTETTPSVPNSAGAMISNVEDQLAWLVELTTNARGTLDPATFAERLSGTSVIDGMVGTVDAGYGLGIYGQRSLETGALMIGHGGELSGYQTLMFHYPGLDTTDLDDLFVVANVNTFLNVPETRDFLPSDINNFYYDLQRTTAMYALYSANPDGCTSGSAGTTCTGTTLADTTRTLVGSEFTIQPSGARWTAADIGFDEAVPTYVFYGNDATGVAASDATITIEDQGHLEGYGNGMTLLSLSGAQNTVNVAGELVATGASAVALDASASSADRISVARAGTVTGDMLVTGGADHVTIDGTVNGDLTLGPEARLDGTGAIYGMVSGAGVLAPGDTAAASAGAMTLSRYEADGGTLDINVFGDRSNATRVVVDQQTAEGFTVPDTGVAVLEGGTLRLSGTPLEGNAQIALLTANQGIDGTFSTIEDSGGILASGSTRLEYDIVYTDNEVLLTSTSPAAFDAVAAGSYLDEMARLESVQNRAMEMSENTLENHGVFFETMGTFARYGAEDGVSEFNLSTGGFLLGFGTAVAANSNVTVAFAKTTLSADIDDDASQSFDNTSASVTWGTKLGALNVAGTLSFGRADVDYARHLTSGTARGTTTQDRRSLMLGVSQYMTRGDWRPAWRASVAYSQIREDGFKESAPSGTEGLTFEDREYERLRVGVGVETRRNPRDLRLSPWVSADLLYTADTLASDVAYEAGGSEGVLEGRSADGLELRMGTGASYTAQNGAVWSAGITAVGRDNESHIRLDARVGFTF